MKVLQIINSLATGGAEKLLLETLPLYNEKGLKMDVLVLNGIDSPFLTELKKINCCTIHSLGTQSVYNPMNIFKIVPYLKNYDLIHVHLFPAQYWVVLAKIISFANAKLIFTEHSTSNRRIKNNKWIRYIDRFFYKKYTEIICITPEVLNVLHKHTAIPEQKFKVIPNGVNISKVNDALPFLKNSFFSDSQERLNIVIQVSSFQEPKDQSTLIRSMVLLPHTVKLLLVGEGILKKECDDLVRALGLQDRVFFLGLRMDVPQLLKTADIVVLSSKYEGLSLSSIEGMASGRPFVASDAPGLVEVVKGAGVLFPTGDEKALAHEISKLLEDEDYYHEVALACEKRAASYDINIMVEKHITLYNSFAKT